MKQLGRIIRKISREERTLEARKCKNWDGPPMCITFLAGVTKIVGHSPESADESVQV